MSSSKDSYRWTSRLGDASRSHLLMLSTSEQKVELEITVRSTPYMWHVADPIYCAIPASLFR